MGILASIDLVIHLVNLFVQYEPKLESDVRDILAIVHKIRGQVAADQGDK